MFSFFQIKAKLHPKSILILMCGFNAFFGFVFFPGHFMGKKSVVDTPLLPSAQAADAPEPAAQIEPGELFQEFLRVALRAQLDTRESRSKDQVRFGLFTPGRAEEGKSWSCWTLVSGGRFADEDFRKLHSTQKMMSTYRIKTVPGSARFGPVRRGSTQFDRVYSPLVMIVTFCHA